MLTTNYSPKKQTFLLNNFQRLLAIIGFIFYLNIFFFHPNGPTAFILKWNGFYFLLLLLFWPKKNTVRQLGANLVFSGLFLLLSANYLQVANLFVSGLLRLSLLTLIFLQIYHFANQLDFVRSLMELCFAPLISIISYLNAIANTVIKTLKLIFSPKFKTAEISENRNQKLSKGKSIFIGLILGLPVVAILLSLFSQADPIFASTIRKFFSEQFIQQLPARIILSTLFLILLLPFIFLHRKKRFVSPLNILQKISLQTEMATVMVLVAFTIGSFLIIQWPYVFAKVAYETDLSKFGVATYSEYVNKGFGELLVASIFIFSLLWLGLLILRGKKIEHKSRLIYVQLAVIFEFIIFIASLFRRVWLYQNYHGWSLARIYGVFLLIWILGMTGTLVLRHFINKKWVVVEIIFTAILMLTIGSFNTENFIATTHPPTVNGRIDYIYLARMSADGLAGWKMAYQQVQTQSKQDWLKDQFLDIEERRQLAYAGEIIYYLSQNYHRLITNYGSATELKNYYQTILQAYVANLENQIKQLEITASVTAEQIKLKTEYRNEIELIKQKLELLNKDDPAWQQINIYVYTIYQDNYHEASDMNWPYDYSSNGSAKLTNNFDRFLMSNNSEKRAYTYLKEAIGIENLIKLQNQYSEYYQHLRTQPESEQNYDRDISLNSPFLR